MCVWASTPLYFLYLLIKVVLRNLNDHFFVLEMKVLQGIKQIMQLFVDQGYALNGSIEEIGSGKSDELMFRVWTSFNDI